MTIRIDLTGIKQKCVVGMYYNIISVVWVDDNKISLCKVRLVCLINCVCSHEDQAGLHKQNLQRTQ